MKKLLASVAIATLLSTGAQAQDASTVIATVGDVDITLGHMIAMRARLPEQYRELPDEVLYNGLIDQLIQQEVLAAAARTDITPLQQVGLENEERAFLAGQMIDAAALAPVDEDELRGAYEARYANEAPKPEFNAAHILVETEEKALELIAMVEGGSDFADLAKEHSTGPSGPNGGDLGWFGLGMMVPPFEAAVLELETGAVSAPVQTQFGWHVVKLNEKRSVGAPDLEEVRAELEQELRAGSVDKTIEELSAATTITRTGVEVDPALIRNLDLLAE